MKPVDNAASEPIGPRQWTTPAATGVGLLIGAAALAAAAGWALRTDAGGPGVLLLILATLGVAWFGGTGLAVRPRLLADDAGVTVRGVVGARTLPWDGLRVSARRTRHLGRESVALELDDGHRLTVLGRWELGAPPSAVADELEAMRPARGR